MEISFSYHPNSNELIAANFCMWHDSWAVLACVKILGCKIIRNGIAAKWNFHQIWFMMEKSFMKYSSY